MMTDPIADLFTRIRNGLKAGKQTVEVPSSRAKQAILALLQEEGYINGFVERDEGGKPVLAVSLKYHQGAPAIETIRRVSKPGRRVYTGRDDLPRVNGGLGVAIISTSQGVMADRAARAAGHGGEVLGFVF
jgi:small subunit ribosomal protein S8